MSNYRSTLRTVLLVSLMMLAQSAPAAISDGLTAYFPFNGSANDASSNGSHGTSSSGVSFTDGVAVQAARFDGLSGHVQVDDQSAGNLGTNATIAFWFHADASNFASGEHRIFEKDAGAGAFWRFGVTSAGLVASVRGSNLSGPPEAQFELFNPEFFTEFWTAIALRKTGGTFELFVNGTSVGTRTTTIGNIVVNSGMNFGSSLYANSQFYAGRVDEARIYDRALGSTEIALLANPAAIPIPEPHIYALVIAGIGLVCYATRRRRPL